MTSVPTTAHVCNADLMTMFRAYALNSEPAFLGEVRSEWTCDETLNCRVPP